MFKNY